jgi:hypothetical protein
MTCIDTTRLIEEATDLGGRALEVQQEPAVQKAWSQAGHDVASAAKSVTDAVVETRSAWRRSGRDGAGAFARVRAA